MDQGIRAVWYDLPEDSKDSYIEWLHDTYLPEILGRPGILWAAHYEVTGGGAHMDVIANHLEHVDIEGVGKGKDYVMLIGAGSPHVFFKPMFEDVEAENPKTVEMNALRQEVRINVFTEEARVNGPDFDYRIHDTTPGPAIQMGSFGRWNSNKNGASLPGTRSTACLRWQRCPAASTHENSFPM